MNKAGVRVSYFSAANSAWWLWLGIGSAVFLVMLASLEIFPRITQDGSQIVELGRVFLNPSTPWSANWLVQESQPLFPLSYLGASLLELAYQAGTPSLLGPRVLTVAGALGAASVALGWMKARGTPPWVAFCIALVFLLDPIFESSYRQGRADSLAFMSIFSACWLLRVALRRAGNQQAIHWHLFLAGILAGLSPFLWSTSLALIPLVLLETFYLAKFLWMQGEDSRLRSLKPLFTWYIAGGAVVMAILALPILGRWEFYPASLAESVRIQQVASVIKFSTFGIYLLRDPLLLPTVLVALLVRREPGLILATLVAWVMMSQTMIYPMRLLYLLPYLTAFVAVAFAELARNQRVQYRRMVLYCFLAMLLTYNAGVTLIQHSLIAFHQKNARLPENITQAMEETIGSGARNVLTLEWDVYFAGRALGWNLYKIFGRISPKTEEFGQFLAKMDYVILRTNFLFMGVSPEVLEKNGFEYFTRISYLAADDSEIELGPFSFHAPTPVYDDVLIYKRQQP